MTRFPTISPTISPTITVVYCIAVMYLTASTGCQTQPPPSVASAQSPSTFSPTGEDNVFAAAMMKSMAKMDQDMTAAPMTGDPDHDFAIMMIPHHQGAADMAKAFTCHTRKDPTSCAGWPRRSSSRSRKKLKRCAFGWRERATPLRINRYQRRPKRSAHEQRFRGSNDGKHGENGP